MTPAPEYLQHRIDMFDKLKAEADAEIARAYLNLERKKKLHKKLIIYIFNRKAS
jgi:hypothetical protein